ncbi:SemiSWEET family sugar transporter [Dankookia sp. P2]|uniref:SemiSWEET family sugar transporter n=1 Tax=Dankookia sp. P2 TaxID=3423955 RepID=UPI003D669F1D
MDAATLVGSLAALATATSFVPQAWKVIRTRDTAAVSAGMCTLRTLAILLWLIYGLLLGQWPLIVTNGICLPLSGFILAMKLLPPQHRDAVAKALVPAP